MGYVAIIASERSPFYLGFDTRFSFSSRFLLCQNNFPTKSYLKNLRFCFLKKKKKKKTKIKLQSEKSCNLKFHTAISCTYKVSEMLEVKVFFGPVRQKTFIA